MRFWTSFRHAFHGCRTLVVTQPAARIHIVATVAVIAAGAVLGLSAFEWCWLVVAMTVVWMAEALNTAVEFLGDAVADRPHPLVGRAKDVASAGVLLAAMGAGTIGVIILLPHVVR